MLMNSRLAAMGVCVGLLGVLSIVSGTLAQVGGPPPVQNCQCGPVDDCNGIPLTAFAHCDEGESCACVPVWNQDHTCITALDAICYTAG